LDGLSSHIDFSRIAGENPMNSDNKNYGKTANGADANSATKNGAAAGGNSKPMEPAVGQPGPKIDIKTPGRADLHPLNADMRSRWTKFVDGDLKGVKTPADLSTAVASKYGISEALAATQVKEWAVGRQF
jgi:hypothetical protein